MEAIERQLGEQHQRGTVRGGLVNRAEPVLDVPCPVEGCGLLDERDFHAAILSRHGPLLLRARGGSEEMTTQWAVRRPFVWV